MVNNKHAHTQHHDTLDLFQLRSFKVLIFASHFLELLILNKFKIKIQYR